MNIKIEGQHKDLKEIHQSIYEMDPNLVIEEEYNVSVGFQREPVVTELLVALSPIVIAAINGYYSLKKARVKADVEKSNNDQKNQLEKIKLYIQVGGKWKPIELEELQNINTDNH